LNALERLITMKSFHKQQTDQLIVAKFVAFRSVDILANCDFKGQAFAQRVKGLCTS
jgi:hypothetical protein